MQQYHVSFLVGHKNKPEFDEIVRHGTAWVGHFKKVPQNILFNTQENFREKDVRLERILMEYNDAQLFASEFEHEHNGAIWTNKFSMSYPKKGLPRVQLSILNDDKGVFKIRPPMTISHMQMNYGIREHLAIKERPKKIGDNQSQVENFIQLLKDKERVLPVVLVTPTAEENQLLVDPLAMHSLLLGAAHLHYMSDKGATFRLSDTLGKWEGAYNGAVKIYWPMNEDEYLSHHIWMPDEVFMPSFKVDVLERIAKASSVRFTQLSYNNLQLLYSTVQLSHSAVDIPEIKGDEAFGLYTKHLEEQNTKLMARVADLSKTYVDTMKELENERRVNEQLKQEKGELESILEAQTSPDEKYESVYKAICAFQKKYPRNEEIVIAERGWRTASDCKFEDPQLVMDALEWLKNTYLPMKKEGGSCKLKEQCMKDIKMQYKGGQSSLTVSRYRDEYTMQWHGKKVTLEEHLGKGKRDARYAVRIAFHYDKNLQQIVVGFIGYHQKNRHSS